MVTACFEGAIVKPIRASIAVRASIDEALRRWSDHAAPLRLRQVDFESLAHSESRVTVEADDSSLGAALVRRALERQLAAFKCLIEGSVSAPTLGCHEGR